MAILRHAVGEWCNRQHATLWMSKLGFESLFPSCSCDDLTLGREPDRKPPFCGAFSLRLRREGYDFVTNARTRRGEVVRSVTASTTTETVRFAAIGPAWAAAIKRVADSRL